MTSFNRAARFIHLLGLVWLCSLATAAWASVPAATVLFSQGTVTLSNTQVAHDLKKGDTITAGDTIHTGADGRAQLRFSDGGLVALKANTDFAVDKYNQPEGKDEGSLSFNLIKGGLRTLSGTIGKKDHANYQLKTSVATLGIRGTQFTVSMEGGVMRVHVGGGQVALGNDQGEILLSTGDNGEVHAGQAPTLSLVMPNSGSGNSDGDDDQQSASNDAGASQEDAASGGAPVGALLGQALPADYIQGSSEDDSGGSIPFGVYGLAVLNQRAGSNDPTNRVPQAWSSQSWSDVLQKTNDALTGANLSSAQFASGVVGGSTPNMKFGIIYQNPLDPNDMDYFTGFVVGKPMAGVPITATTLPEGTITYKLADGASYNGSYSPTPTAITSMELLVDLQTLNPTPRFRVTSLEMDGIYGFNMDDFVNGTWSGSHSSFKFTGTSSSNSDCPNCVIDASGIFAGLNGKEMGLTFTVTDYNSEVFYGVAALDNTGVVSPPTGDIYSLARLSTEALGDNTPDVPESLPDLSWTAVTGRMGTIPMFQGTGLADAVLSPVEPGRFVSQVNISGNKGMIWGADYSYNSVDPSLSIFTAYAVGSLDEAGLSQTIAQTNGVLYLALLDTSYGGGGVYLSETGQGNITALDMKVDLNVLASPAFQITNMEFDNSGSSYSMDTAVTGFWNGSGHSAFQFTGDINDPGGNSNGINAAGVLSGNGSQAGLTFTMTDANGGNTHGVAQLAIPF